MNDAQKEIFNRDEDAQADYLGGQTIALTFLRKNPMFKSSVANSNKMEGFLKAGNLAFTIENLEKVLADNPEEFELSAEPILPNPIVVEDKPLPPWGLLNKAAISAIDRDQYRRWMKNPQFQKDVNAALQRGE